MTGGVTIRPAMTVWTEAERIEGRAGFPLGRIGEHGW